MTDRDLFGDVVVVKTEPSVDDVAALFLNRWVPSVQQAAAKPELDALISAIRQERADEIGELDRMLTELDQ